MPETTNWRSVFTLFVVGAVTALLLAKAAVALPVLQVEFGLTLFEAGLLVSIFSLVAALFAALFGAIADRYGQRRTAIIGLLIAILASTFGAFSPNGTIMLASRICEGLGFFLVSTAIPPLMLQQAALQDRQKAMGLWGAFVPAGGATVLLAGGIVIDIVGWQGLWLLTSAALVLATGGFLYATRDISNSGSQRSSASLGSAYRLLLLPGPLTMALIFACYSAQYMSVVAYLPLILVEEAGWSIAAVGLASGIVFGCNIIGNVASGMLLDRGYSRQGVLLMASIAMGLGAIGLYSELLPISGRLISVALFSAIGGLIPGALFAGTATHAPDPTRLSSLNGLLLQGAALGQLLGPPIAALCVGDSGDWARIAWFSTAAAALIGLMALVIGRLEK